MGIAQQFKINALPVKSLFLASGNKLNGIGVSKTHDKDFYIVASFPNTPEEDEGLRHIDSDHIEGVDLHLRERWDDFLEMELSALVDNAQTNKPFDFWMGRGASSDVLFDIGQAKKDSNGLQRIIKTSENSGFVAFPTWRNAKGLMILSEDFSLMEIHLLNFARHMSDSIIFGETITGVLRSLREINRDETCPTVDLPKWEKLKEEFQTAIHF
jgi:hypothetical protein